MKWRSHGEKRSPICALSMAQLVALRLQALEYCREQGWPESRLYDALEKAGKSDEVVTSARSFWRVLPRAPGAVPVDVEKDRDFFRQVMDAELEARRLNELVAPWLFVRGAVVPCPWVHGEDAEGVGLSLSVEERTVAALEKRHQATRPREGKGKGREKE